MELLRQEKGSVMLLVCVALTALLAVAALVIDGGNLYGVRARLANTADAAALAGVALLPGQSAEAVATAQDFAQRNGVTNYQVVLSANKQEITVTVQELVPYYFARVLGLDSQLVSARAKAQVAPLVSAKGVVPFGIEKQNFTFGSLYTLKEGAGEGYSGNYGALSLGGKGAANYLNNILYGYQGTLQVGDWVSTEPGNMSGPTSSGVSTRIKNSTPGSSYMDYPPDCSRVITVPVLESLEVNGRKEVQIVGFAKFFLEGVGGKGQDNYVTGYFLEELADGDGDSQGEDFGLRSTRLIE